MRQAYIFDAVRTPRGIAKPSGALHSVAPLDLLTALYHTLQVRTGFDPGRLDDVVLGCVSQYGEQAGNIARASVIHAGWPEHVPGLTLNRFCSSSLDAACLAYDRILSGSNDLVMVGGVESMSRVPMLSDQPSWMMDFSAANQTRWIPIGVCADLIASEAGYCRSDLDAYAVQSQQRASAARVGGYFKPSLVALTRPDGKVVAEDETIRADSTGEVLAQLPAAFAELGQRYFDERLLELNPHLQRIDHQHTVGNAPRMADAASALLIGCAAAANSLSARAEIIGYRSYCGPVDKGLTGGTKAAQRLLRAHKLRAEDLDLIEFNEAFAGPTLKFISDLRLDPGRVNVNGGAIALGHPMGATGGNLMGTLLDELERRDNELGMVVICGATGSGTAMLIRRE